MANKAYFPEIIPVRLPEGTRKELAEIAKRRYQSTCAFARQAIMRELELAREKDGYCLLPDGDNKAA
jgi:predicted transcriptional regulator